MSTDPARTFVRYLAVCFGLKNYRILNSRIWIFPVAACLSLLVSGCNTTKSGLVSDLPVGGGAGVVSFTSNANVTAPAIIGRTYKKILVTSVKANSQTGFPISPITASGTAPLSACSVSGNYPGGLAMPVVDSSGSGCLIAGTPTTIGTYTFTVQAVDSNSPPRSASQSFTLVVMGEFSVNAIGTLPAAVQGRSYGHAPQSAPLIGTTLAAGTAGSPPIATGGCVITPTPSNPGLTAAVSGNTSCALSASSVTAAGSFSIGVSVTDSPINDPETSPVNGTPYQSVPANTRTAATNGTLAIGAPLKLVAQTDAVSATPPNGVVNRSYGTAATGCSPGPACLPLTYVVTGGLPSVEPADNYSFSTTGLAGTGLGCAASASSAAAKTTCTGTPTAAGPISFSVTADDSGSANTATPSGSASSTTSSYTPAALTVDASLALAVSPDPASYPAVVNRAYGTGTGCSGGACVAPLYTPSGGLPGGYALTPPAGGTAPAGLTCTVANQGLATATASCSAATITGSTSTFAVTAADNGNASTPSGSIATSRQLTVDPAVTLTAPASPALAVDGRPYGANSTVTNPAVCGAGGTAACAPAAFAVSGGLGGYSASATTSSAPGTWVCPFDSANSSYDCATTAVSSAGPFPITPSLTLNAVTDTGSVTTPSGSSNTPSAPLTVNGALALGNATGLQTAVDNRGFGSNTAIVDNACGIAENAACAAAAFPVSGGTGIYAATPTTISGPGTWQCPLAGTNYNCATSQVSVAGPYPASPSLSVTTSDVANASTPKAASNTASTTLIVNTALALTPPSTVNDAVTGRTYGSGNNCLGGSACTGIAYTVAGGLGNYNAGTLTAGGNTLACTGNPTYTCAKSTAITGSGSQTLTMTVSEYGNANTPTGSVQDTSRSLTVDAPITLTATIASPWPFAVQGRTYGEGVAQDNFNATGGIAPYVSFTPSGFPTGFTCTPSATSTSCASGDVTGAASTYSPAVTVVDTGNASTPPATTTTDPNSIVTSSLTVAAPLAINAITLPNSLQNYPYPTVSTAATLVSTGGLGGNTWIAPPATSTGACPAPTGALPTGITLASSSTTASISGTPTTASTAPGQNLFQVCVTDTPNSMTPAGFAVPNTTGNDLSIDVLAPLAYLAETSADEIEIVNTSTKASVTTSGTGAGSAPYGVAYSPSGRYAYVTLSGTNQLAVFDTITGTQTSTPASPIALTGCTTPHGVAATSAFIFIACYGSGNIAVVDTTAFAVSTIPTDSTTSAPEGVGIRSDNLRVYATLSAENELFAIDNSGATPVALAGLGITNPSTLLTTDGTIPLGITVAPNAAGYLAYIAKQGASGTVPDGIEIVTLTNDALTPLTSVVTSADSSAMPSYTALTPDNNRVYVTLTGADEFAVFNNALATPAQIASSPIGLSAGVGAEQLTSPPVSGPSTSLIVYIAQKTVNNVAVIDNKATPSADAGTPTITLSGAAPFGIASTPAPQ